MPILVLNLIDKEIFKKKEKEKDNLKFDAKNHNEKNYYCKITININEIRIHKKKLICPNYLFLWELFFNVSVSTHTVVMRPIF